MSSATETLIESGTLHFSIDGEYLTDLTRDLVLEGRWRYALRVLMTGLQGIDDGSALAILRGEKKLLGVNTVEFVDEDRSEKRDGYLETLSWQYAGLWRRSDGYWQPYAKVVSFGPDDMPRGEAMPTMLDYARSRDFARKRCLYYADRPDDDRAFDERDGLDIKDAVLWRRVSDPPLWVDGESSGRRAVEDHETKRGHLQERGACEGPGLVGQLAQAAALDLEDLDPEFAAQVGDLEDLLSDHHSFGLEEVAREALGEKGVQALAAIMGTQQDDADAPEPDPECKSEGGYILTDGSFYAAPYMGHAQLALRLLRHVFRVEQPKDPQKEADRRNWLRIQPSALRQGKFSIMSPKGRPTKAQERTLVNWCIAHQYPYPDDLK